MQSNKALKAAALIDDDEVHHLDHIGTLAAFLDIPLLTSDFKLYKLGKKFYPDLDICYLEKSDFLPTPLANSFNYLFVTQFWSQKEVDAFFKECKIRPRIIYCPHGNSDKGQTYTLMENFAFQEIVLIYGKRMQEFLQEKKVILDRSITIGNFRLQYFLYHRAFYKPFILPMIDRSKKTILYAPTWNPLDSSLFYHFEKIVRDLPEEYALIFKVHPAFERYYWIEYLKLEEECLKKKNIYILKEFPPIYPLLDAIDLYLGDASSIAYDFLYFEKPMFFILARGADPSPIHQTGEILDPDHHLFVQIEKGLAQDYKYRAKRQELYKKTYAPCMDKALLWKEILKL